MGMRDSLVCGVEGVSRFVGDAEADVVVLGVAAGGRGCAGLGVGAANQGDAGEGAGGVVGGVGFEQEPGDGGGVG